jgi:hypothetical protein
LAVMILYIKKNYGTTTTWQLFWNKNKDFLKQFLIFNMSLI